MDGLTQTKVQEFLNHHSANPAETSYYHMAFALMDEVNPPLDEISGFACMMLLENMVIELADGRLFDVDFGGMGTIEHIAKVVHTWFPGIGGDHLYWKVQYSQKLNDSRIQQVAMQLIPLLEKSDLVKRVHSHS